MPVIQTSAEADDAASARKVARARLTDREPLIFIGGRRSSRSRERRRAVMCAASPSLAPVAGARDPAGRPDRGDLNGLSTTARAVRRAARLNEDAR